MFALELLAHFFVAISIISLPADIYLLLGFTLTLAWLFTDSPLREGITETVKEQPHPKLLYCVAFVGLLSLFPLWPILAIALLQDAFRRKGS